METFVVRIFVPATDEKLELTGVVEHSSTGRSEHFRGPDGLLSVVLHQLELAPPASPPSGETTKERER
jgi:hypothetical protein